MHALGVTMSSEPWKLSFRMLFKSVIDTARHAAEERQIRLKDGSEILHMCRAFFAQDQTPRVCLEVLEECWPDERFQVRNYTVSPEHGHFEVAFVGRTIEFRAKSRTLLNDWNRNYCVNVSARRRRPASCCCISM